MTSPTPPAQPTPPDLRAELLEWIEAFMPVGGALMVALKALRGEVEEHSAAHQDGHCAVCYEPAPYEAGGYEDWPCAVLRRLHTAIIGGSNE